MPDLTGIGAVTKALRKDTTLKYVPDAPAPTAPITPFTAGGMRNASTISSGSGGSGGYYIRGTNQWGQEVLMYVPPNATTIHRSIG